MTNYEDDLTDEIASLSTLVTELYQAAENEMFIPLMSVADFTVASLDAYPLVKTKFESVVKKLSTEVYSAISNSIVKSWDLANTKNDKFVDKYFKGWKGDDELIKTLYKNENLPARKAFIERKTNGLNLSERVWHYNEGYKEEIEDALQIGISNGVSAKRMAKLVKDYLRNPSVTALEVDNAGVATKILTESKPGRGVYRDPMKNALRLARTETNMAYRTADNVRYSQLDFVVGYEVHLSKNHTSGHGMKVVDLHDVCDELQGRYPKTFKFVGWHPNCRCYVTSILKTPEEFEKDEERMRKGEKPSSDSKNAVTGTPPQLSSWIADNTTRLEHSTSLPYFVRDNAQFFSGVNFNDAVKAQFTETAAMRRAKTLTNAKIRHDARTQAQIDDIKARWAAREKEMRRQATLEKAAQRHSLRTPQQIADIQERWAMRQKDMRKQEIFKMAAQRHAARTPEQIADIRARWAEHEKAVRRAAIFEKAAARHAARTAEEIADIKARWELHEKEVRRQATLARAAARHAARKKSEIKKIQKAWDERKERLFTVRLGSEYLDVAKHYKFDSAMLDALGDAVDKKDAKSITKAMANIKKEKNVVKKMPHVTLEDFKTYTADELKQVSSAVSSKLQSISNLTLAQQESKLKFEIQYIQNNMGKYATMPISLREYQTALADIQYKIKIEQYAQTLADYNKSGISSKKYDAALKKAEKAFNGGKLAAADEADFKKLLAAVEKEKQAYITDFVAKNEYIKAVDFSQFTVTELEQAQAAVANKIKSLSALPLDQQKSKLEFEIGWVQKNKKYSTWSISERAYKEQLVAVEYKIRINEYSDHLANLTSFSTADATYQKTLQKASAILGKAQLTAADEDALKALLSDLDKQKKVLSGGKALTPMEQLQEDVDERMSKLHGIYSKAITNKYGKDDWIPSDQTLQDMQRKLKKMIEDEAYANFKTDPPTAPIKKYTKAQIAAAEKTWNNAHFSLSYVQGSYGGIFAGDKSFYTGKFWDAIKADKAFAAKLQKFGVNVTWEELNTISTYAYKSGFINKYLLGLGTPSASAKKALDAFVTVLNNTLTKMPKYKGTTYRGACVSKSNMANDGMWKDIMDSWNKGGVWESKTPMSSTANVDTSEYFATGITASHIMPWDRQRVLFKIKGKTGVSISEIAGDPKQDEVLFRAGSKFKMVKKPYQVTSKNAEFGAVGDYIVELEEI